jgi:hypothetical protein
MSRPCPCGSGQPRRDLADARGIFCGYVCNACERRVRRGYDAEIFTDPNYSHDEPVDGE